jgi:hypothetical protein
VRGETWAHVDAPIPGPVKTRPGQVKPTLAKVRRAREQFSQGARQSEIARRYSVTPMTTKQELCRET